MKKIYSIIAMAFIAIQMSFAADVITHDVNQLPANARKTLQSSFPKSQISYIKIDKDMLQSKTYEVKFTNGVEIDFDSKGNWKEVDCKKQPVPDVFVPAVIRTYVKQNYKGSKIVKVEKDRRNYEVKLQNGLELKFDSKGKLVKLDD